MKLFLCASLFLFAFSISANTLPVHIGQPVNKVIDSGDPKELVKGLWWSENKSQKIQVYENKGVYYGKIVWMKEDDASRGTSLLDHNNPNPELRSRHITGVDLLHHFVFIGNRTFVGRIYDPISGKDYQSKIIINEDGRTASIRGYVLMPMFGRTENVTKAD